MEFLYQLSCLTSRAQCFSSWQEYSICVPGYLQVPVTLILLEGGCPIRSQLRMIEYIAGLLAAFPRAFDALTFLYLLSYIKVLVTASK